jgi:hypothetical protein
MDTVIVYIDDAAHARQQIAAAQPVGPAGAPRAPVHWVLVACAPRMAQRVSKWVSHSAREHWRAKWAGKLFGELTPWLRLRGDRSTEVVATGPLPELQSQLQAVHRTPHVVDLRRPKATQVEATPLRAAPGGLASLLGLVLVFSD